MNIIEFQLLFKTIMPFCILFATVSQLKKNKKNFLIQFWRVHNPGEQFAYVRPPLCFIVWENW